MEKKCYKLQILPLFENDLNGIVDYIVVNLQNSMAAEKLIDEVEKAIQDRLFSAESFESFDSKKERNHKYYRIFVRNFVIFYVAIDDVMEVRRILYNRRNFIEQI